MVILINSFIQLFDGMQTSWGRFVFLMNILYIHVFAALSLCGKEMYNALRGNVGYSEEFIQSQTKGLDVIFKPQIIKDIPLIKEEFLDFAFQKTKQNKDKEDDYVTNCFLFYQKIKQEWYPLFDKEHENLNDNKNEFIYMYVSEKEKQTSNIQKRNLQVEIMNTFVFSDSQKSVKAPMELITKIVDYKIIPKYCFDEIIEYVIDVFIKKYGNAYLKILENNHKFDNETMKKIRQLQRTYLLDELQNENLTTKLFKFENEIEYIELD